MSQPLSEMVPTKALLLLDGQRSAEIASPAGALPAVKKRSTDFSAVAHAGADVSNIRICCTDKAVAVFDT